MTNHDQAIDNRRHSLKEMARVNAKAREFYKRPAGRDYRSDEHMEVLEDVRQIADEVQTDIEYLFYCMEKEVQP